MSDTAVVAGAGGAIGRVLCAALREQGEVVELHRQHTSGDIQLPPEASVVYHVAGSQQHTVESQRAAQLHLAQSLYHAAAATNVRRFVYLSSIKAVAGEHAPVPVRAHGTAQPGGVYGQEKASAEAWLREQSEMRLVILRAPMVYGAHLRGSLEKLDRWIRAGRPLPVSHTARRHIVYVDNLVHVLVQLRNMEVNGDIVSVADDDVGPSTAELAQRLARLAGLTARTIPIADSLAALLRDVPGIRGAAQRLLGSLQFAADETGFYPVSELPFTWEKAFARAFPAIR